jgi:hypothetical protein
LQFTHSGLTYVVIGYTWKNSKSCLAVSLAIDVALPPIFPATSNNVTADERTSAIDFINRLNILIDEFDHNKMLSAFYAGAVVHHFHGKIQGLSELRTFLKEEYT